MRMIPPPERLPGLSRFVIADPPPATWSITSRRGCDQRVETSLSPDRADLQNPLVVEPMVGFRTWRLEGGRLRSPHHPMPDPWPLCATHAVCAATKTGGPACRALPTVDRGCGCGLHGEYEVTDLSEADVWGAVLAWGNLVLSDQGFRSEWQRPILLAAPQPGHLPPMALQGAASAYGAGVVAIGQLESAARKYGTPAPAVIVPITPLFLLSMYARQPEPPYPQTFRKLIDRIVMGSIAARWQLAGYAVDIAVDCASRNGLQDDHSIARLETALTGVAAAVERWKPDLSVSAARDQYAFRAEARLTIDRALARVNIAELDPPTTRSWGEIRELADALSKARDRPPSHVRAGAALDEDELVDYIDRVAFRRDVPGELGDSLLHCLSRHIRGS
jgi:hypothetical protein